MGLFSIIGKAFTAIKNAIFPKPQPERSHTKPGVSSSAYYHGQQYNRPSYDYGSGPCYHEPPLYPYNFPERTVYAII